MMLALGFDNDGHNHDDRLGEIYPAMLNELNCTFGVSCSRFRCCGHRGHGLWPSWYRPVGTQDVDVGCTLAHLSFCQRVVLVVVLMMSPSDYLPIWGGGTDVPKRWGIPPDSHSPGTHLWCQSNHRSNVRLCDNCLKCGTKILQVCIVWKFDWKSLIGHCQSLYIFDLLVDLIHLNCTSAGWFNIKLTVSTHCLCLSVRPSVRPSVRLWRVAPNIINWAVSDVVSQAER